MRRSYSESVAVLKGCVEIVGDALPAVTGNPRHDDKVLGPSVFRAGVEDASLDGLTLPGLYVGRSVLTACSFKGSDLSLCTFNWSGLKECSFEEADLSRADLRACKFERCTFDHAILDAADLRGSSFRDCTFRGASFAGTLLCRRWRLLGLLRVGYDQQALPLSAEQRLAAAWTREAPEAGGG